MNKLTSGEDLGRYLCLVKFYQQVIRRMRISNGVLPPILVSIVIAKYVRKVSLCNSVYHDFKIKNFFLKYWEIVGKDCVI